MDLLGMPDPQRAPVGLLGQVRRLRQLADNATEEEQQRGPLAREVPLHQLVSFFRPALGRSMFRRQD